MTSKPKPFTADARSMLPRGWLAAAGAAAHHSQGGLLVVAPTKSAAVDLLLSRGLRMERSERLMRDARVDRDSNLVQALTASGVADLSVPGVYVWSDASKARAVVEVGEGGSFATVGHYRPLVAGGVTVEPVA